MLAHRRGPDYAGRTSIIRRKATLRSACLSSMSAARHFRRRKRGILRSLLQTVARDSRINQSRNAMAAADAVYGWARKPHGLLTPTFRAKRLNRKLCGSTNVRWRFSSNLVSLTRAALAEANRCCQDTSKPLTHKNDYNVHSLQASQVHGYPWFRG